MKSPREPAVVLSLVLGAWLSGTAAAQTNATFPDPNLEAAVRSALIKPTGPISLSELEAMTWLVASHRSISNLSGLEWAVNLSRLDLAGNAVSDLAPLQGLSGLADLALDRNQISNLSPLSGLTNLSSLALGENPISDYSTLSSLTNLTSLSLYRGSITSLAVLQNLNRLASLNVFANGVQDLSPLTKLTNLDRLDLRWNAITNCDLLSVCTNLTDVYLGGNAVSNLNSLQPLKRLTFLNVESAGISDLSALAVLTNLEYVVLSGNPGITNYPVLSGLTGLANLELRGNSISNLTFLSGLSRLRFADLAYNSITNLSPLAPLTNLGAVNLSGNPAMNLNQLSGLAGTSNLWLLQNSISNGNLALLTNMTQLTALGLDDNLVSDFSPLAALTNLQLLSLSQNPIANYGVLAGFTNLTGLWLEGNSCSNLDSVQGLTSLKNLSIRNNRFRDLAALAGLTNLSTVYAADNRLTNIAALTNLPGLARAELSDNLLDLSATSPASGAVQSLQSRGVGVNYLPTNRPPILWTRPVWYIPANQTSSLSFYVSDSLVFPDELTVTASSSDQGLVPDSNITFSGTGSSRSFTATPATNRTGFTVITLVASQPPGGLSVSNHILATVMFPTNVVLEQNLADAVSAALDNPATNLTSVDLMNLTSLYANNASIDNLSGLEWASNLVALSLRGSTITNLAPLQNMAGLVSLRLSDNLVTDVSPLAGLTNLAFLDLRWNPITNFAALSGLSHLASLFLAGGSATNLVFLTNLTQLEVLGLSGNRISDITPLASLTNLSALYLQQNRLTNVDALTNLPHLAHLDLSLNLLADDAVGILASNGVTVQISPQRTPPEIDVRTNWLIAPNTNSVLSFDVWDTGPPDEQLSVGASVSSSDLALSLTSPPGQIANGPWTLAVSNQVDTNASRWITLTATNDVGLSTNARILVVTTPLVPVTGQWFGNPDLAWISGGDAPWCGQGIVSHGGSVAAQSGAIANNQASWLQTTVEGPGKLTFWWRVSSETGYDWLQFSDADYTNRLSGEVDWQQQTTYVPPGVQTLTWLYVKDQGVSSGLDAAWLAQVTFVPGIWLELVGGVTNQQRRLLIHADPSRACEIQISPNLATWSTLTVVVPTNSATPFLDASAGTVPRYYRVRSIPLKSIWLEGRSPTNGAFQLTLHSPPNLRFSLQASASLTNWTTLTTLTNTLGTVEWLDTQATGFSARFYRAVLLP